eukprot:1061697-Prorocentrum_minimum.AAC.2
MWTATSIAKTNVSSEVYVAHSVHGVRRSVRVAPWEAPWLGGSAACGETLTRRTDSSWCKAWARWVAARCHPCCDRPCLACSVLRVVRRKAYAVVPGRRREVEAEGHLRGRATGAPQIPSLDCLD